MAEFRFSAIWLIAIITGIYFIQILSPAFTEAFVLESSDIASRPWILFTSMFLHGSIVHLLSNMFALFLFGLILEKEIGTKKFLLIYAITGIFAGYVASMFYPSSLGASGAIFGVMGTLAILKPGMQVWVSYMPMPMIVAIFVWALIDFMGILVPSEIASAAHLAGMFLGIFIGIYLRFTLPRPKHTNIRISDSEEDEIDEYERRHGLR